MLNMKEPRGSFSSGIDVKLLGGGNTLLPGCEDGMIRRVAEICRGCHWVEASLTGNEFLHASIHIFEKRDGEQITLNESGFREDAGTGVTGIGSGVGSIIRG